MDERLKAGLPTFTMKIFAAIWFGFIAYAAFQGGPRHAKAVILATVGF